MEIAVVTRNRPRALEPTLESLEHQGVLNQTIVVDGSENDNSKKICEEFGVEHYFQDSSGMTAARNEALGYIDSEYVVFIDDDVRISDSWYEAITDAFEEENVVGVAGRLEDEELDFGRTSVFIRNLIFGGKDSFGEILSSGVVNGDFFYDERKEVDHMPGCNMAFCVKPLKHQGGFDEEFDVGSSYGEDTAASLRAAREGKIVYEPDASLRHLKVGENRNEDRRVFFDAYNTRFLQQKYDPVQGLSGLSQNLGVTLLRYAYYVVYSVSSASTSRFVSYFKGDLLGLWDFWLRDRKPSDRL